MGKTYRHASRKFNDYEDQYQNNSRGYAKDTDSSKHDKEKMRQLREARRNKNDRFANEDENED